MTVNINNTNNGIIMDNIKLILDLKNVKGVLRNKIFKLLYSNINPKKKIR